MTSSNLLQNDKIDIHAELESEYYLVLLLGFAVGGRLLGTLGLLWRERRVRLHGFRHQD